MVRSSFSARRGRGCGRRWRLRESNWRDTQESNGQRVNRRILAHARYLQDVADLVGL
jgi:hypothetical protein